MAFNEGMPGRLGKCNGHVSSMAMFLQSIGSDKMFGWKLQKGNSLLRNSDGAMVLCMMMMAVEEGLLLEWKCW